MSYYSSRFTRSAKSRLEDKQQSLARLTAEIAGIDGAIAALKSSDNMFAADQVKAFQKKQDIHKTKRAALKEEIKALEAEAKKEEEANQKRMARASQLADMIVAALKKKGIETKLETGTRSDARISVLHGHMECSDVFLTGTAVSVDPSYASKINKRNYKDGTKPATFTKIIDVLETTQKAINRRYAKEVEAKRKALHMESELKQILPNPVKLERRWAKHSTVEEYDCVADVGKTCFRCARVTENGSFTMKITGNVTKEQLRSITAILK